MHNSPSGGNIPVMSPRLRTLIDLVSASAEPDAVLLRRFADTRNPQAFAELVRRYGRLVWGQCRQLLNSETDADDAFQATFLTLAKSARTLRDTNKLGPWLHGVAYRVCQQAKRAAGRRSKREKATAKAEASKPVADSAWDAAFTAVHDELAKLPDTLRVPFILCVLEGKGLTEAAAQLGLKLGTFSSRLSRAKELLLDRLTARGLTAGLATIGAAAVGASVAPAAVAARACDLAAGGAVSANILSLTHGVLTMAMVNAKGWVVAAVLGCGLAAGVGGVMTANGQDKKTDPKPMLTADEQLKRLQEQAAWEASRAKDALEKAQADAVKTADALKRLQADEESLRKQKEESVTREVLLKDRLSEKTAGPEFRYFGQGNGYAPTAAELERTIKQVEADGYTFVGVVTMKGQTKAKDNEAVPTLVFRRTAVAPTATSTATKEKEVARFAEKVAEAFKQTDRERELQDQIDVLNKQLAELQAKGGRVASKVAPLVALEMKRVGGDSTSGSAFVTTLVRLRYGEKAAGGLTFEVQKDLLVVKGLTQEQAGWLSDTMQGIAGSTGPKSAK